METESHELVRGWRDALGRAEVVGGLEEIYTSVAAAIAQRGPACWASGRCCNFERTGHRLYATGLETAYTLARHAGDERVFERIPGSSVQLATESTAKPPTPLPQAATRTGATPLTRQSLESALTAGACPFQVANLCGVHPIRPLGCRIYFCDRSAQQWQQDLYESAMARLRALHDRFAIEYRYGEWRAMLGMFVPSEQP